MVQDPGYVKTVAELILTSLRTEFNLLCRAISNSISRDISIMLIRREEYYTPRQYQPSVFLLVDSLTRFQIM